MCNSFSTEEFGYDHIILVSGVQGTLGRAWVEEWLS